MKHSTTRRQLLSSSPLLVVALALGEFAPGCAQSPTTRRLPIPPLLDAQTNGGAYALETQAGETRFFGRGASRTLGFNGSFLGPTIRVRNGERVGAAVTNRLDESTTVHWHGLLVPSEADGGPHSLIQPGETWRTGFEVRQPAATLWYHAHPHPRTGSQVYAGLAGVMIVADGTDQALRLPSTYGVDDIPLILRDAVFDGDDLVYPLDPMTLMRGVRGSVMLANGVPEPTLAVPRRLVRLRIVNAANARVFDLSMSDSRPMSWIATDGGLLERPVRLRSLLLAPGQRAEILVDFSDGRRAELITAPDLIAGSMGGMGMMGRGMGMMGGVADPLYRNAVVLRFEPQGPRLPAEAAPVRLVADSRPDPRRVTRRRRLTLTMGMGMGMMGPGMGRGMMGGFGIDGRPFDMERIDQEVRVGDTEIWEVSGDIMPHPFHMHGVHFHVLSRGGGPPAVTDQGRKDTVLVQEPVELLVQFSQAAKSIPFMFHCHTLEHEDGGMMGQYLARR